MKKRLYITLYPEEINKLKEISILNDKLGTKCRLSLSDTIGRLIRIYDGENLRF